jgi:hypothetical protein
LLALLVEKHMVPAKQRACANLHDGWMVLSIVNIVLPMWVDYMIVKVRGRCARAGLHMQVH